MSGSGAGVWARADDLFCGDCGGLLLGHAEGCPSGVFGGRSLEESDPRDSHVLRHLEAMWEAGETALADGDSSKIRIGDKVELEGRTYRCDAVGWTDLGETGPDAPEVAR